MSERNKLGVVRVVVVEEEEEEEEEYAFVFVGVSSITSSERKSSGSRRRDGTTDARIIVLFFSSSGEAPHQSEGEKKMFWGEISSHYFLVSIIRTHSLFANTRTERENERKKKRYRMEETSVVGGGRMARAYVLDAF